MLLSCTLEINRTLLHVAPPSVGALYFQSVTARLQLFQLSQSDDRYLEQLFIPELAVSAAWLDK